MVEIDTLGVIRKYVKYLVVGDSTKHLEERYPVVTAIARVFIDMDKVGNKVCPFCDKSFSSRTGLYKHLLMSGCRIDYTFTIFSIYKVVEYITKKYNRNRGCYEVAGKCIKPKDVASRILEVKPTYSQLVRSIKSERDNSVF